MPWFDGSLPGFEPGAAATAPGIAACPTPAIGKGAAGAGVGAELAGAGGIMPPAPPGGACPARLAPMFMGLVVLRKQAATYFSNSRRVEGFRVSKSISISSGLVSLSEGSLD